MDCDMLRTAKQLPRCIAAPSQRRNSSLSGSFAKIFDKRDLDAAWKERSLEDMMDVFMLGMLAIGFALIRLFLNWCQHQVDSQE